jgi:hypothetical protein
MAHQAITVCIDNRRCRIRFSVRCMARARWSQHSSPTCKPPYYSVLPHHFPELSQLSQAMAFTNAPQMASILRSLQLSLRTKLLLPLVFVIAGLTGATLFVVRKPGLRAKFRAELLRKLPFEAEVVLCDGRDLIRMEMENPFGAEPSRPDIVRFVSILSRCRCALVQSCNCSLS